MIAEAQPHAVAYGSDKKPPRKPPAPSAVSGPKPDPPSYPTVRDIGTWRTRRFFGRPWQDLIFAIGEVVFLITLIPLLFKDNNVGLFTGLGTAIMLYAFLAAHVSYRNWITVGLTGLTATLWVLIGAGVHF